MKFKLTIYTDIMINILIELTDTSSPPFLDTIFFRSSGGKQVKPSASLSHVRGRIWILWSNWKTAYVYLFLHDLLSSVLNLPFSLPFLTVVEVLQAILFLSWPSLLPA